MLIRSHNYYPYPLKYNQRTLPTNESDETRLDCILVDLQQIYTCKEMVHIQC